MRGLHLRPELEHRLRAAVVQLAELHRQLDGITADALTEQEDLFLTDAASHIQQAVRQIEHALPRSPSSPSSPHNPHNPNEVSR